MMFFLAFFPVVLIQEPSKHKIKLINLMKRIVKDESSCGESYNSLLYCSIRDDSK